MEKQIWILSACKVLPVLFTGRINARINAKAVSKMLLQANVTNFGARHE